MQNPRTFWVTVYKQDSAFFPDGEYKMIHCNHTKVIECGINTVGEIVAVPTTANSEIPGTSGSTDFETQTAMVPQATISASPTQFSDSGFKAVTEIKDNVTQVTSWVATAQYNANIVACNPSTHN